MIKQTEFQTFFMILFGWLVGLFFVCLFCFVFVCVFHILCFLLSNTCLVGWLEGREGGRVVFGFLCYILCFLPLDAF